MIFQIYPNLKKMYDISNLPKYKKMYAISNLSKNEKKMYAILCYLKEFRGFKY